MPSKLLVRSAVSLVALAGLVSACGSDNSSSSSTTAAGTSAAVTTAPTGTTAAAATTTAASTGPAASTSPAGTDPLRVVLLIGGPANDGGFYQAMVDGLKDAAAADGSITVDVREKLASGGDAAMDDAVRQAAAGGEFDLVVAHGFDLVPYVAKYAAEFPDQKFATSLPVDGNPANTEVYLSVFEQIGYNAGFLASQGTTAKKTGFIGGPGLPFEKQAEAGFKEAVAKYAPGAEVSVVYTGTFEDPQLAQETTTQMIADGVDSIWNQQAAGQSGVYTACAAAPQVNCFGNSSYSEAVSPGTVLASTVSDYGILLPEWAERLRTDAWVVGPDFLDQKGGGTAVTDATDAGSKKIAALQSAIDSFRADIAAGKVTVTPAPQG